MIIYILILQLAALLHSFGGIFSKLGSQHDVFSIHFVVFYFFAIMTLVLYAFVWQILLKKVKLSSAYSSRSTSIIWTMIWGVVIFSETITPFMIIGSVLVIIGVIIMGANDD